MHRLVVAAGDTLHAPHQFSAEPTLPSLLGFARRCQTSSTNASSPIISEKKSVELVKCETNDIEVPATSDFVIEGYVDPTEPLRNEGPFGDPTGYYTLPEPHPVFHVLDNGYSWRDFLRRYSRWLR